MAAKTPGKIVGPSKSARARAKTATKRVSSAHKLPKKKGSPATAQPGTAANPPPLAKLPFVPGRPLEIGWAQGDSSGTSEMHWSPFGHRVALRRQMGLSVLSFDGHRWVEHPANPPSAFPKALVWSRDGRHFFVLESVGHRQKACSFVVKRDAEAREIERFPVPDYGFSLDLHRDEQTLAVGLSKMDCKSTDRTRVRLYDAQGSVKRRPVQRELDTRSAFHVKFDPSGELLLSGHHGMTVHDMDGNSVFESCHGAVAWIGPRELCSMVYSGDDDRPSGLHRIFLGHHGESEIDRIGGKSNLPCAAICAREPEFIVPLDFAHGVLISPDSEFVAASPSMVDPVIQIIGLGAKQIVKTLTPGGDERSSASFTAGGHVAVWGLHPPTALLFENTWQ